METIILCFQNTLINVHHPSIKSISGTYFYTKMGPKGVLAMKFKCKTSNVCITKSRFRNNTKRWIIFEYHNNLITILYTSEMGRLKRIPPVNGWKRYTVTTRRFVFERMLNQSVQKSHLIILPVSSHPT